MGRGCDGSRLLDSKGLATRCCLQVPVVRLQDLATPFQVLDARQVLWGRMSVASTIATPNQEERRRRLPGTEAGSPSDHCSGPLDPLPQPLGRRMPLLRRRLLLAQEGRRQATPCHWRRGLTGDACGDSGAGVGEAAVTDMPFTGVPRFSRRPTLLTRRLSCWSGEVREGVTRGQRGSER